MWWNIWSRPFTVCQYDLETVRQVSQWTCIKYMGLVPCKSRIQTLPISSRVAWRWHLRWISRKYALLPSRILQRHSSIISDTPIFWSAQPGKAYVVAVHLPSPSNKLHCSALPHRLLNYDVVFYLNQIKSNQIKVRETGNNLTKRRACSDLRRRRWTLDCVTV